MKENAHLAIAAANIPESVLDSGHAAGGGTSEVVGAHGKADATLQAHLVVVVHARIPALAPVDRETAVLLVATLNSIATHEVGHGLLGGGAESVFCSFGGLEHHVRMAVGVQLASGFSSSLDEIAALLVDLGDIGNRGCPLGLDLDDLGHGHRS